MTCGQLGLTRVVGHLGIDAGGQTLVAGPLRLDEALRLHRTPDRELDTRRQLLLADGLRREPYADVVVPRLVRPRSGGVSAGEWVDVDPALGEILHGRGDLADEHDLCPLGCPHAQFGVSDSAAHRLLHQLVEDVGHSLGRRNDVHGAQESLGDPAHLGDLPVDSDATTVALELAGDRTDRVGQLIRRLVVVLPVGEQDRVALREHRHRVEEPPRQDQPGTHRGTAVGAEHLYGLLRLEPGLAVHLHHSRPRLARAGRPGTRCGCPPRRRTRSRPGSGPEQPSPPSSRPRSWSGPSIRRCRR